MKYFIKYGSFTIKFSLTKIFYQIIWSNLWWCNTRLRKPPSHSEFSWKKIISLFEIRPQFSRIGIQVERRQGMETVMTLTSDPSLATNKQGSRKIFLLAFQDSPHDPAHSLSDIIRLCFQGWVYVVAKWAIAQGGRIRGRQISVKNWIITVNYPIN